MRSWVNDVRWMLFGTLVLSACGSSNDGALSGNNGGYSGGGGQRSTGGSSASGGSVNQGSGGANSSGAITGTGNVNSTGNGGSSTGTGGAQNGAGGASKGSGGTIVGAGGAEVDGGEVDGGGGAGGRAGTGGRGGNGAGGRPANCPMRAPTNATACTMAEQGADCTYGAEMCTCTMQGGRLDWRCMRNTGGAGGVGGAGGAGGAGGNATNCPMAAPMTGGMCTRATRPGQSNNCRYGTDECTCGGTGAMSTWTCLTCPAAEPMPGAMCSSAGTCTYTTRGRTTLCTCRAPVRGTGGAGGASMTWGCI